MDFSKKGGILYMNLYTNFLLRLMFFVKIKNILLDCNKFAKICPRFSFLNIADPPPHKLFIIFSLIFL